MSLEAETNFGLSLLREASVNQTTVISPISVALALSLVHLGAKGNTKEQLKNAICKESSHANCSSHFASLQKELSKRDHPYFNNWKYCNKPGNISCVPEHDQKYFKPEEVEADYPLLSADVLTNIANRIYVSKTVKVKKEYRDEIEAKFNGTVKTLDFSNAEKAADSVNYFVKMETAGKITKLVGPDSFNDDKLMFVANAFYFHGWWALSFTEAWNKKDKFYQNEESWTQVTFMKHSEEKFCLLETQDYTALALPYKDWKHRMTIVLPKKRFGLEEVLKNLNGDELHKLTTINESHLRIVNVALPKFKIDAKIELEEILGKLGITDPFTDNANLSGITDSPLKLGKVMDKVTVDVNEKGTTAAASTLIQIIDYMAVINNEKPIDFVADHPFLFFLSKEGNILLSGKYYG